MEKQKTKARRLNTNANVKEQNRFFVSFLQREKQEKDRFKTEEPGKKDKVSTYIISLEYLLILSLIIFGCEVSRDNVY